MTVLKKIKDIFDRLIESFALLILTSMVIIISVQVVSRYFFSYTPRWSEELSLIFMVWFGFIGIAIGFKENLHIGIEVFYKKFPASLKKACDVLRLVLTLSVGSIFTYFGWQFTVLMANNTLPGTRLPTSVLYAVVPIVGVLSIIYGIESFLKRNDIPETEVEEG